MNLLKLFAFGVIGATLSACSGFDIASRNAPMDTTRLSAVAVQQVSRDYTLDSIRFAVPANMKVSESNSYYPIADIVWRGDPMGNRAEQISAIFQTAITGAGDSLDGDVPITVDVELARFHSLTDRTRYSVGGVHSIKFDLTVRHAETGEILEPVRRIDADLAAIGGYGALVAERDGRGQKVRITTHLTNLFREELTGPSTGDAVFAPAS